MQKKTEELFVLFPGKDARLYVFRLSTIKKGLEERQLIRGKCDSRENKLEKTKGNAQDLQEYAHSCTECKTILTVKKVNTLMQDRKVCLNLTEVESIR